MRIASFFLLLGWIAGAGAAELKPGRASGTYTYSGTTVAIEHVATFDDKADGRNLLVLILSSKEIPTAGWDDGADFMKYRMKNPFLGVAFWLDESRKVVRAAYFDADGLPHGEELGLFELALDVAEAAQLKGSARSTESSNTRKDPVLLDVTFNAPQ